MTRTYPLAKRFRYVIQNGTLVSNTNYQDQLIDMPLELHSIWHISIKSTIVMRDAFSVINIKKTQCHFIVYPNYSLSSSILKKEQNGFRK
ncbi:hypothetical protein C4F40_15655 [Sphingobacterium sp. Ka21]|uniref:Uncharacterized protein n=1 Tax=Sphingobacterium pedocola TaxID=2082722 RepID=A0ABR9TAP2_9SPHI|nr:hypothetical protein [Sphingobacterium pedocola]